MKVFIQRPKYSMCEFFLFIYCFSYKTVAGRSLIDFNCNIHWLIKNYITGFKITPLDALDSQSSNEISH